MFEDHFTAAAVGAGLHEQVATETQQAVDHSVRQAQVTVRMDRIAYGGGQGPKLSAAVGYGDLQVVETGIRSHLHGIGSPGARCVVGVDQHQSVVVGEGAGHMAEEGVAARLVAADV